MKHTIQMLAGCVLPLTLLFVLPLFGITGGATLLIVIAAMFVGHLWMMGAHSGHGAGGGMGQGHSNHNHDAAPARTESTILSKGAGHEHHQH